MNEEKDYMITTIDNPFNPFTQWDEWWNYDHQFHHYTWETLDRLLISSHDLPIAMQDAALDDAVQSLMESDAESKFIKVNRSFDFSKLKQLTKEELKSLRN